MKKLNLILILTVLFQLSWAQNSVNLEQWKISNPQKINMPVFADVKNIDGDTFKNSDMLTSTIVNLSDNNLVWTEVMVGSDSVLLSQNSENNLVLLESYLSVNQWTKGKLKLTLNALYEVYLDNELIKTKKISDFNSIIIE
ncbi:MAG: hypothetical protein C0597_06255 [Marinilabiliales bacterium]|nr:MAG: hypothetical protein C0597_06255 [Marinilabiliales bacterium]